VGPGGPQRVGFGAWIWRSADQLFFPTQQRLRGMRGGHVGSSLIHAVSIFLFALSPLYYLFIALLAIVGSMQMSYACWPARPFRKNVPILCWAAL